MTELDDGALIRKYRAGSQQAYAELAKRYVSLIYASALRQTRDPASADDVTQAVLIVLARKADSVRPGDLPGWLMKTTWYAARDLLRRQRRAQARDRMAACDTQQAPSVVDAAIQSEVLAILDESLARLRPADRNALTLRFLQNKSFAAVGAALGTTDEGARRRTSRTLQRLRGMLEKRGVAVPAAGLSAVLTTAAAPGAPAHVLASVSAAALVPAPGDMAWVIAQAVLRTRLMASARIAGVLLLVSIAVVGALLVLDTSPPSVPEASAQTAPMGESPPLSPNEITLVGLRADGDDVLLDASGNTIGLLPDWDQAIDQWNADSLRRDIILDWPKGRAPVQFLPNLEVHPSGQTHALLTSRAHLLRRAGPESNRVIIPMTIPSEYSAPNRIQQLLGLSNQRRLERGDIVIRYYSGPRGAPEARFAGPFTVGAELTDRSQGTRLRVIQQSDGRVQLKVIVNRSMAHRKPLSLYDAQGNWSLALPTGSTASDDSTQADYNLPAGWHLSRIASVAYNEKPHEKIIPNVLLAQGKPTGRTYSPYLDAVAQRLGKPGVNLQANQRPRFENPAEAIRVIDLVRGYDIRQAVNVIQTGSPQVKFDTLEPEDAQRVRQAANDWLNAHDLSIRAAAVELGLMGHWPEFVKPALEVAAADHRSNSQAAHALSAYREHLTADQLAQVTDLLLECDDPRVYPSLYNCLRLRRDETTAKELQRLAQSDRVWLWFSAIYDLRRSVRQFPDDMTTDPRMRRRIIQAGLGDVIAATAAEQQEAFAELPKLLTPKLVAMNTGVFNDLLKLIAQNMPRDQATHAVVTFLGRMREEWNAHDVDGFSISNWWAVDRSVRYLNKWHGVDIGHLGSVTDEETRSEWRLDWRLIAAEAIHWHETRYDPALLPVDWQPSADDLRIVWRNTADPELSVIAIWSAAGSDSRQQWPLVHGQNYVTIDLSLTVTSHWTGTTTTGVLDSQGRQQELTFQAADLPLRIPINARLDKGWQDKWELWIEPAAAADSVLHGTELFDRWRNKYLSNGQTPLPRIFHTH